MFHVKHSLYARLRQWGWKWGITIILPLPLALGGCTPSPPPSSLLARPASELMQPSAAAPSLKPGSTVADLLKQHARLKSMYGQETGKLKGLQRYIKALHGDK